jgi:hypothetical protein
VISQETLAILARIARNMPHNADIAALEISIKADLNTKPVVPTPPQPVVPTCLECSARRAKKAKAMKKYRAQSSTKIRHDTQTSR